MGEDEGIRGGGGVGKSPCVFYSSDIFRAVSVRMANERSISETSIKFCVR